MFSKRTSISETDLAQILNFDVKELSNQEDQNKLTPLQSENLLKLISIFIQGELLLGSINNFKQWLNLSSQYNVRYIDLLQTSAGMDFITEELDRIANGYPI